MRMYDLINEKKRGGTLTDAEIRYFVTGFTDGSIPDYQASALLMAICLNGMDDRETRTLTMAMAESGDMLDLTRFKDRSADKHSTGGVGDKTTLIVAPIVAACGGVMAKMTGRGLGHTGGTLDKLESIPGYRSTLTDAEFMAQAEKTGIAVVGQSGNMTPADKKLYALRDVTATVDSIPLIVSSIMSKKLAAGAHSIVLDVKTGSGSFMKTKEDALSLASKMVEIGTACGRNVTAVLTNMDLPLGGAVGNALEVQEAISVLKGDTTHQDLVTVCLTLSARLLSMSLSITPEEGMRRASEALSSGKAFEKFRTWIGEQGGDLSYVENPAKLPQASLSREFTAPEDGFISAMQTEGIGLAACSLGAGRAAKGDRIDPAAGIKFRKKTGDAVSKGEIVAVLYANDAEKLQTGFDRLSSSVTFTENEIPRPSCILGIVGKRSLP